MVIKVEKKYYKMKKSILIIVINYLIMNLHDDVVKNYFDSYHEKKVTDFKIS